MKSHKILSGFIVGLIAMTLVGCSGEPSSSDIDKAFRVQLDQFNKLVGGLGGKTTELNEVKKIGCTASPEASGYVCDVEIDSTAMGHRAKGVQKMRLVKGSDGWVITR